MYGALNKISFSSQFIVSNFSLTQTAFCCFYWGCTRECPFIVCHSINKKKWPIPLLGSHWHACILEMVNHR